LTITLSTTSHYLHHWHNRFSERPCLAVKKLDINHALTNSAPKSRHALSLSVVSLSHVKSLMCFLSSSLSLSPSYQYIHGSPEKVNHYIYQIIKKSDYIVLKPTNEIRFVRQIKVSVKHDSIIPWY